MTFEARRLWTKDHCQIFLHKFQQQTTRRKKYPVLLLHGFAANARMWWPPTQKIHLLEFLDRQGYRVYALDLRYRYGAPQENWDADDYIVHDIPTALSVIAKETGVKGCHWVGHSMGGLLCYMYQALNGSEHVVSQTVLGSPGFKGAGSHSHWVKLTKQFIRLALLTNNTGRLDLIPPRIIGKMLKLSFISANPTNPFITDHHIQKFSLASIVGNVSQKESIQMCYLGEKNGLRSEKLGFYYDVFKNRVTAPLLAFSGDRDFVVPPLLVKKGFDNMPAMQKKYIKLGNQKGCLTSYGHLDLIMGPNASVEIWPQISGWLNKWDKRS